MCLIRIVKNPATNVTGFVWLRGPDLNQRPSGYEPDELPGCSTPRYLDYFDIIAQQDMFVKKNFQKNKINLSFYINFMPETLKIYHIISRGKSVFMRICPCLHFVIRRYLAW